MEVHLYGKNVLLQEAEESDIETLYYWRFEDKEQEAKKWNGPYIPEEKITKEAYFKSWDHQILGNIPSFLTIICDGKAVGYVGAYWVDKNTSWLETGIVIYNPDYWNGGYGFEAYKLWINYLFKSTKLHRLGMSTWSGNGRMIRVAEKLGMKEEARIRKARIVNGRYFDAVKMGILKEEWESVYHN
ncbi:GNAT family N-acetyltransferase [Alkalicoccus urumqiensis]|uniref:N-acetyltransferase n=1 Tax=Alkalicoccus urumqiensis TaxID=1548213 RepID=A0A2P6MDZ9_ALKUR|nr:GNAT family protein [Alkalicoccus urumqiensis]PRO64508.1 N-acetyltransferase [Alkalicoccus urumqiensis]